MKSFTITEKQLQEIAGRLNLLVVQGIQNNSLIAGINDVLVEITKAEITQDDSNVVDLKRADAVT